jgi:hypothetical protein
MGRAFFLVAVASRRSPFPVRPAPGLLPKTAPPPPITVWCKKVQKGMLPFSFGRDQPAAQLFFCKSSQVGFGGGFQSVVVC